MGISILGKERLVKKKFLLILMCLSSITSCSSENFLEDFSKTDSNAAYYFEAKQKIDQFLWDEAIEIIQTKLTRKYQDRPEVKETLMHAFGGKCGISFFDFINNLKKTTSNRMFVFSLQLFAGRAVDMEACDLSLETLHSISEDPSERTNQQNLFAAILGLTRMATTLRAKFDVDASGLGDGIVDATSSACVNSSSALRLSDTEVDRIVAGVGLIFENLTILTESLTEGSAGNVFGTAKTICEANYGLDELKEPKDYAAPGDTSMDSLTWAIIFGKPAGYKPTWTDLGLESDFGDPLNCMNTKDADVSNKMRRVFRRMIESSEMGFGTCDIGNVKMEFNPATKKAAVSAECCPGLVAP